jgi:outer membrane murein-binding lipoprotein Lpp
MVNFRRTATMLVAAAILGGCASEGDALDSSRERASEAEETLQAQADFSNDPVLDDQALAADQGPRLGTTVFQTSEIPPFQISGTFVGRKVGELREDLDDLQATIDSHNRELQDMRARTRQAAGIYHQRVGVMNARLQVGTTPGNPVLVQQWNRAQGELQNIDRVNDEMNALNNEVGSTSSLSAFLLDSVQSAYGLSGAMEVDHEHLALVEDATNRSVVLIDRLHNELSEDTARQSSYLSRERQNLITLSLAIKNGEFYGDSLANMAFGEPEAPARERAAEDYLDRQALVVIRFDDEEVAYEQAVYNAISQVLDRRPQAAFDVLAVAPQLNNETRSSLNRAQVRRLAGRVLRSMNEMGLPPNRVSLAATTSHSVDTNEVHIYIR